MKLNRENLLPLAFAWVTGISLTWVAILLRFLNRLAVAHYHWTFDGRPLPFVTDMVSASASPFYWFPVPAILFALFANLSDRLSAHDRLAAVGICACIGLAGIATIVFGTVLPAILSHSTGLKMP